MTTHDEPLGVLERRTFGDDATRDSVSGRVFEQGVGAHPKHVQAKIFAREAQLGRPMNFAETQAFLRDDIAEQVNAAAAALTAKLTAAEQR